MAFGFDLPDIDDARQWWQQNRAAGQNYAIPSGRWPTGSTTTPTSLNQALGQNYAIPGGPFPAGTTATSGPNTPWYTPYGTVDPRTAMETFARKYPYLASFMSHPEIGAILRQAAIEGWGEQELYGALSNTNWWRNTSDSQRVWDQLVAEDPAQAARLAAETASSIQNRARTLGLELSDAQIASMATTMRRNGWSDEQLVDNLLGGLDWDAVGGGDLTAARDQVYQLAGQFLVDVSESTARDYALAIASGEMSLNGVASIMQAQALQRFPWMAEQIQGGITPTNYLAPVRDTIARELEVAPEAISMMDPKWLGMLEITDPDTGQRRAATQHEAMLSARRQPEYWGTGGAQSQMAGLATALSGAFGRRVL